MTKPNVLLPKQKWVTIWVAGDPQAGVVATDSSHFLNRLHKVRSFTQSVEVERKLSVFYGLSCWNYEKDSSVTMCVWKEEDAQRVQLTKSFALHSKMLKGAAFKFYFFGRSDI